MCGGAGCYHLLQHKDLRLLEKIGGVAFSCASDWNQSGYQGTKGGFYTQNYIKGFEKHDLKSTKKDHINLYLSIATEKTRTTYKTQSGEWKISWSEMNLN